MIGSKGIEVSGFENIFYNLKYDLNVNRDVIIGYEFGRNFFDFSDKILFPFKPNSNERNGGFAEAFADIMYLYAYDEIITNPNERELNETILNLNSNKSWYMGYINDSTANPYNSFAKWEYDGIIDPNRGQAGHENPAYPGKTALFATIDIFGKSKMFPDFFNLIRNQPKVNSIEDALSNIAFAASKALNANLNAFFQNVLKFNLNTNTINEIEKFPSLESKLIKDLDLLYFYSPKSVINLNLRSTNYLADNYKYLVMNGKDTLSFSKNGNNSIPYNILKNNHEILLKCYLINEKNVRIDSFYTTLMKRDKINLLSKKENLYSYYLSNETAKSYFTDSNLVIEGLDSDSSKTNNGLVYIRTIFEKDRQYKLEGEIKNITEPYNSKFPKMNEIPTMGWSRMAFESPARMNGSALFGYDLGVGDTTNFFAFSFTDSSSFYIPSPIGRQFSIGNISFASNGYNKNKTIFRNSYLSDVSDIDGDSIIDFEDNCPLIANPEQADINNNGVGDVCDSIPVPKNMIIEALEEKEISFKIKAIDAEGDTLTYLISDSPKYGTASISDSTITYTSNKDYFGSDTLSFIANDGVNDSEKGTIIIHLANVNDSPSGLIKTSFEIPEGDVLGITIDTLNATDVDLDELSYLILSGNENNTFSVDGNLLILSEILDYESKSQYELSIGVYDGTDTTVSSLNINVLDVANQSIELPVTINVYDVVNEDNSKDMDYGEQLSAKLETGLIYSISGGDDKDLFTIDSNTGKISFITQPDFENPSDANKDNRYEIIVSVTNKLDGDVNPPKVTKSMAFNVPETNTDVNEVIEAFVVDNQTDTDGDGILDDADNCLVNINPDQTDTDGDGYGDVCDDSDGDGVLDDTDSSPDTPAGEIVDATGTSEGQKDDDNDGVLNAVDKCPQTPVGTQVAEDGCELILGIKIEPNGLMAYPNPFHESLTITFNQDLGDKVDIRIRNTLGQEVYSKSGIINGQSINLKQLPAGQYILNIQSMEKNGKGYNLKIVKE